MDLDKGPGGDDGGGTKALFKQKDSNEMNVNKRGSWGRGGGLQMVTPNDKLGSAKGNAGSLGEDVTTLSNERDEDWKEDDNSKKKTVSYGSKELKRLAVEYKDLVNKIQIWEKEVEDRKEAVDDPDGTPIDEWYQEQLKTTVRNLAYYKQKEKNNFYAGSNEPMKAWGDMSEDEEEEEEKEKEDEDSKDEEMGEEVTSKQFDITHTDITYFEDSYDDEEMSEEQKSNLLTVVGKRKSIDNNSIDDNNEKEGGQWQLVVGKKNGNQKFWTSKTKKKTNKRNLKVNIMRN